MTNIMSMRPGAHVIFDARAPRVPDEDWAAGLATTEWYALMGEFAKLPMASVPLHTRTERQGADWDAMKRWWAERGYQVDQFTAWLDGETWHLVPVVRKVKGTVAWVHQPRWGK